VEVMIMNGTISTTKLHHSTLIMHGVCEKCAHCGQPLTDSVSIERGIGPVCSKRGYHEDEPKDADEIQAMIDLAEYPDLVEFLTEHYKPQGVRGLMNGLVKVCSLNRKHECFAACCEAISSLGYDRLASTLRESIAVVVLTEPDNDHYKVWVKKSDFSWPWYNSIKVIPGFRRVRGGCVFPKNETSRKMLWAAMREHYEGLVVKTPKGAFKIGPRPKKETVAA
jgi:hypothetical protein